MNRIARAPVGSSPAAEEVAALPRRRRCCRPGLGDVEVGRIAIVVNTKFSKLTMPSAKRPSPTNALTGTTSSSLLPPSAASTLVSTASARMTIAISRNPALARGVISPTPVGRRTLTVDINPFPSFSDNCPHVTARSPLPLRRTSVPRVIPSDDPFASSVYGQPPLMASLRLLPCSRVIGIRIEIDTIFDPGATSADTGGAERSAAPPACPEGRARRSARRQPAIS